MGCAGRGTVMGPYEAPVYVTRTHVMFLAKVDIAALILHSVSAGMTGLILLREGVIGGGSALSRFVSLLLFLVNVGTVLRVVWRGERRGSSAGRGERSQA